MCRIARSRAIGLGMLLGAALLGAALIGGCGGASPSSPDHSTVASAEGHWEKIGAPRGARGFQQMVPVVAGEHIVLLAGGDFDQESVKALVFDIASQRWSHAAPSGLWWRAGQSVVAAGRRVIVWGGCCGGGGRGSRAPGAIYDVAGDDWRTLEAGPLGDRYSHTAVWTGEEMIVWGGVSGNIFSTGRQEPRADGAAFDPRSGRWRPIAPAPLSPRERHVAVWTGEEMIVWGGQGPVEGHKRHRLFSDGAAYDPERDSWRTLAPARFLAARGQSLPEGLKPSLTAAWTGEGVIIWDPNGGGVYDPESDEWSPVPPAPPRFRAIQGGGSAIWTGEELIVWGGEASGGETISGGAAYDPQARRWAPLPKPPIAARGGHAAVWTGEGMLVWGGFGSNGRYETDGAIYLPD